MCGITGISVSKTPRLVLVALWTSLTALAHRGPDDSGVFEDHSQGVGLVHECLSILDLSSLGSRPMSRDDSRVGLALNGEIYNYRELCADLVAQGISFRSHSDTEVLLNLHLAEATSAYIQFPLADTPRLGTDFQRRVWLKENFNRMPFRYVLLFLCHWLWQGAWHAGWVGYARVRQFSAGDSFDESGPYRRSQSVPANPPAII